MKNNKNQIIEKDTATVAQNIKKIVKPLEGSTLLIAGGSGFLGQYIIKTILFLNENYLKTPCKIISIDNYITSTKKTVVKNSYLQYIDHDVTSQITIKDSISYIIHAAGIASPIYYNKYPLETINAAVNGTQNILQFALKQNVKSVLYFSSSEVYGDPPAQNIPTKETYKGNVSCIGPRACYDESKRLGETLCMVYHNLYKIPVKIVRPFNIYGPGMKMNDLRVIPTFISSAIKKKKIPIYGNGKQTRAFCYITDALEGIFRVLLSDKNGEVYNIGNSAAEISVYNLAQTFRSILDKNLLIARVPYSKNYPQDEPKRRCPDITKIKKQLAFQPKIDLKTGLIRTIAWCSVNWNNR